MTALVFHHLLLFFFLQRKGTSTAASGTTETEMQDLLYLTVKRFHAKTGHYPYLNYDNNKIQTKIGHNPADPTRYRLCSHHGPDITMPMDHNLPQPTHSPDCNRPVEHAFGSGKARVRNCLYLEKQRITQGRPLQTVLRGQFTTDMPALAVREDILQLPVLWDIISTQKGVYCQSADYSGKVYVGSGGGWGPRGTM